MASLMFIIFAIYCIGGFISGIVCAFIFKSFLWAIIIWASVFITASVYLALGFILKYINTIKDALLLSQNDTSDNKAAEASPKTNYWDCPKCGKVNKNYVGICDCGEPKP